MRKLKQFLLFCFFLLPGLFGYGQSVKMAKSAPVIDGIVDDLWNLSAPLNILNNNGDGKLQDGFAANAKLSWDAKKLYLVVQVADKTPIKRGKKIIKAFDKVTDSIVWAGQDKQDHIDIMLDLDRAFPFKKNSDNGSWWNTYDNNDLQISFLRDSTFLSIGGQVPEWKYPAVVGVKKALKSGIQYAQKETNAGWVLEVSIPFDSIVAGFDSKQFKTIGFDVTVGNRSVDTLGAAAPRLRLGDPAKGAFWGDPLSWNLLVFDNGAVNRDAAGGSNLDPSVKQASAVPVIDGTMDDFWYSSNVRQILNNNGDGKTPDGFAAETRLLWDAKNLYVYTTVADKTPIKRGKKIIKAFDKVTDSIVWAGQDRQDHIDIMLDLDRAFPFKKNSDNGSWWNTYDNNDLQISFLRDSTFLSIGGQVPEWKYPAVVGVKKALKAGIKYSQKEITGGWVLEVSIPFDSIVAGFDSKEFKAIGFDQTVGNRSSDTLGAPAPRLRFGDAAKGAFYGDATSFPVAVFDAGKINSKTASDGTIKMSSSVPVIDGTVDDFWYSSNVRQILNNNGDGKTPDGFAAETRLLWDAKNLYVFTKVADKTPIKRGKKIIKAFDKVTDSIVWAGQDRQDHIDIMLDLDRAFPFKKNSDNGSWWNTYDNNDLQISFLRDSTFLSIGGQVPEWKYPAVVGVKKALKSGIKYAQKEITGGWVLEVSIPFDSIVAGFDSKQFKAIGFDQTVGNRSSDTLGAPAPRLRFGDATKGAFYGDATSFPLAVFDGGTVKNEIATLENPTIWKAKTAPVVDGTVDNIWYTSNVRQILSNNGDGKTPDGFAADTRILWDSANLYVFANVADKTPIKRGKKIIKAFDKVTDSIVWAGQDKQDHIDIMLDLDRAFPFKKNSDNGSWWNTYDNNDLQISFLRDSTFLSIGGQVPEWKYPAVVGVKKALKAGIQFAQKETNGGWTLEVKIPFDSIFTGYKAIPYKNIGFDLTVGNRSSDTLGAPSPRLRFGDPAKGAFWGDPASWSSLTFADSANVIYGLATDAPKSHDASLLAIVDTIASFTYDGTSYAIALTPTDRNIKVIDLLSKLTLAKGATVVVKAADGTTIIPDTSTNLVLDKYVILITSEDGKVTKDAVVRITPSYFITATAIGTLKTSAIIDVPDGTTVDALLAGLTFVKGSQGAKIVLASDSVTLATGTVSASQLIKVVSLNGLNNYYTIDSYFGLITSSIGELSLTAKTISKIPEGKTVEQLIAGLTYTADVTTVKVYSAAAVELLSTDAIATGNILKLSSLAKEVSYSLETIIPTVLGLVENFNSTVDLGIWSPSQKMSDDNSRKVFIVTQEENALKVDMQQASFADGQWYKLNNFDMTDTKNRCISFRCKVDEGMTLGGAVVTTVPMQISAWNDKKHPANRYNSVAYTVNTDGKWAYYFYDFNIPYASAPVDADWSFINGLLLETVVWPSMHEGTFWLDEVRVGNEVAKNPNLSGIQVDGVGISTFDRDTLSYTVTLASTATTFPAILAKTEDPRATYTAVNSADVTAAGANTIVTGVSSDGTVTKVYTINYFIPDVTKDATLATLSLSEGTLTPDFNRMIMDYTVVYPIGYEATPVVTATATVAEATVAITQFVNVRSSSLADRTATVKVTATNGTTIVSYNVVATVTLATGKSITAYSFGTPAVSGTINENSNPRKIAVTVPGGTNLTALVATFTASERATVKVGTTVQVSGVTANDFTAPVDYVVTAEDGTTIKYRVTVSFPVGIAQSDLKVLQIYPNPSTGFIALKNISSDEISQITITSMKGQVVRLINNYDGGNISVQELSAGMYNLSVIKKDNTLSNLRFIKQ